MAKLPLGFKKTANHAYMGHFMQEKYLCEGHNTRKVSDVSDSGLATIHTRPGKAISKSVDQLGRRLAKRAIRAGNAAVAAERPALAAKVRKHAAVVATRKMGGSVKATRRNYRSMGQSARSNQNAARQERRANRPKKGMTTSTSY